MDLDEVLPGFAKGGTILEEEPDADSIPNALKNVEGWYAQLSGKSRWMDLIGDYAGSERFVIDGDALTAFVLDDPLLALGRIDDPSFQIVHSKWLLERVIKNFIDRSAMFDVVFWEDSRHLTVRTGSNNYTCISRELARHVLFEHLCTLSIPVHVFTGLSDSQWTSYCSLTRPMLIMTTDGRKGGLNGTSDLLSECLLRQLLFIHDILAEGIAVSLLDTAEFRDSRIVSFILEEQRQQERKSSFPRAIYSYRTMAIESMDAIRHCRHLRATTKAISDNEPAEALQPYLREFVRGFASHINVTLDPQTLWVLRTFLVHFFVLQQISLAQRAQDLPLLNAELMDILVQTFLPAAFDVLADVVSGRHWPLDIDTRIFVCILHIQTIGSTPSLEEIVGKDMTMRTDSLLQEFTTLQLSFEEVVSRFGTSTPDDPNLSHPMSPDEPEITVLPFHNDVLAAELSVVHVKVEDEKVPASPLGFFNYGDNALFVDDKHWHNNKPILPKHAGGEGTRSLLEYVRMKALRRDQRFMANMQKHAETLTGAIGAPLEQQVITSASKATSRNKEKEATPRLVHTKTTKGNRPKALTKAEQMKRDIIAAKQAVADEESSTWWQRQIADFKKIPDIALKSARAKALLSNDRVRKSSWLYQELQLFIIDVELKKWISHEGKKEDAVRDEFTVSILCMAKALYVQEGISAIVRECLERIFQALGFGDYFASLKSSEHPTEPSSNTFPRALSFELTKLLRSNGSPVYAFICITEHPVEWQLRLFGEHMDRSMDSQPDKRVSFKPDAWQRDVLDCLDDNKSVLVVAPTSAGKTFISFYAMEKVLRESDDGILVYVAPTKALVNQVAAEVYARFKKETRSGTVWSIQTRDYRIHDPQKCQILITVPEMFAIMLLSPPLARTWTPRIKRIILDEIHTIGQQEGGAVWEQILLLAPCPIIGLSATIGQPESFNQWLASVQEAHGFQHKLIIHPHRYSHLRKYIYIPSQSSSIFTGLENSKAAEQQLRFIHPVSALAFGNPTMPPDFSMEARDTLSLFQALKQIQPEFPQYIELSELHPTRFFKNCQFLTQKDVLRYETMLKECLKNLISLPDSSNEHSPLHRVIASVDNSTLHSMPDANLNIPPSPLEFLDGLMGLLVALDSTESLPALLFSFDRSNCEVMAQDTLLKLIEAETRWKSQSKEWARKVHQWELHQLRKQERKVANERSKKKKMNDEDARDQQDIDSSQQSTFDPDDPVPQFSFAGWRKYSRKELDDDIDELAWTSTPQWARDALRRGIGVHHSGMNKAYRSLVEGLFRRGFIRVLFCTGTLALGINAPTRTSVFCGDSPFLTALNYRQCAGRAGRRGFDLLGKVVFYGIPMDRIQRLLLSRLPSLAANFPLTSTLSLRLLNLLHGSEAPVSMKSREMSTGFAAAAIKSILSLPQISFKSESGKEQLLHHFRFSIEYLRRARLIDVFGRPMNLYAVAAHLYHTEPSNFALVSLISSGILHKMCDDSDSERVRRNIMLLMCHLFGRRYLHHAYASKDNIDKVRKKYPSLVVLPSLPYDARLTLEKHNQEILQIFSSYAKLYTTQYEALLGPDNLLPLSHTTGVSVLSSQGSEMSTVLANFLDSRKIVLHSRSTFVANSGHRDTVNSIEELTRTSRQGLQLNEFAIPSLSQIISTSISDPTSGAKDSQKLNAYIYDFFMHGQVNTLVVANGIRRGDVWYALEDFNLTLLTIRAALRQLLLTVSKAATSSSEELSPEFDTVDGDMEDDSGYATGSITGRPESSAADKSEEGLNFPRPPGILDMDWRVYKIIDELANEFYEKFKKMWA